MIITLLIIAYSPMDTYSRRVTTFCRARGITTNTLYVSVAAVTMVLCSLALAFETAVPPAMLKTLQLFTIPVSLASKVPQMLELHRDKATGQLSVLVVFAQLLGTLARVFTTLTDTNDRLLIWGFALATVFNAVIAVQVLLYWNGNEKRAALHEGRWYESVPVGRRNVSELPTTISPARGLPKRD